jgi:hypothetical protein
MKNKIKTYGMFFHLYAKICFFCRHAMPKLSMGSNACVERTLTYVYTTSLERDCRVLLKWKPGDTFSYMRKVFRFGGGKLGLLIFCNIFVCIYRKAKKLCILEGSLNPDMSNSESSVTL